MGMLRAKSGLSGFDLPTDAQWEYACRAGTQSSLNDGTDIANLEADPHLDLLGRYRCNGGKLWIGNAWVDPESTCSPLNGTALVGQYAPNAWGFYDMHGNVWEWCLDWYSDDLGCDAVVDPIGPAMSAGGTRVWRSAGWSRNAGDCRSAFRGTGVPALVNSSTGLRVALNLK
jgi:formylglycine-generating enzyme required for sulfatase activity